MKTSYSLFLLATVLFLSACTPHPSSGVWKATQSTKDNDYGISRLVVNFEGWASFTTSTLDNAAWHCFWAATDKQKASLNCTSSLDSKQEEVFILTVNNQGLAELRHKSKLVGIFARLDENPSPKKK
jgi:hypothetical protein